MKKIVHKSTTITAVLLSTILLGQVSTVSADIKIPNPQVSQALSTNQWLTTLNLNNASIRSVDDAHGGTYEIAPDGMSGGFSNTNTRLILQDINPNPGRQHLYAWESSTGTLPQRFGTFFRFTVNQNTTLTAIHKNNPTYRVGGSTRIEVGQVWNPSDLDITGVDANGNPLTQADFEVDTSQVNINAVGNYRINVTINSGAYMRFTWAFTFTVVPMGAGNELPDVHTVRFDTGGTSVVPEQYVGNNSTVSRPDDPVLEHSDFVDWYTDETFTQPFDFNTPITSDLTLYARFRLTPDSTLPTMHTVNFDGRGGSIIGNQLVAAGSTLTRPEDPTRDNYQFAGWYTDENLTEEFDFNTPVTSNMTLYARWTANADNVLPVIHTVNFDSRGGSVIGNRFVADGKPVTQPENPIRANYQFAGWYTDENLSEAFDFNTPIMENTTLYARWIRDTDDKNDGGVDIDESDTGQNISADEETAEDMTAPNRQEYLPKTGDSENIFSVIGLGGVALAIFLKRQR
ncbi:InlB B-repeat-containing protein [Lactococcus ileimucosae]|uniref:InlB B-repeat-containing protein n=1 Tax=Lactococcus ileimucosae TaxID=2941329 RepID=A0ABV4D1Y1_9LACT